MPRLNVEATNQMLAMRKNAEYIAENFPRAAVNDGWAQDFVSRVYASKVYGHGVVTTSMDPPFETEFEEF